MKRVIIHLLMLLFVAPVISQEASDIPSISEQKEQFRILKKTADEYYNSGNYRKSLESNISLLKIALKLNDPFYKHQGYRLLAYDYLAMNDTLMARENFSKSILFAKEAENDTATAHMYMDMANIYSTIQPNYKKAMDYHNKSVDMLKQINDSVNLAKAHFNTVLTAFEAGEYNEGYAHLLRARKLEKFEPHASYGVALDNLMGEYYYSKEKYELAQKYLRKAAEVAEREGFTLELENAYFYLSECLYNLEEYQEAFLIKDKYEEYSIENMEKALYAEKDETSARFAIEEYRKEVQAAELQNSLQAEIVRNKSMLNNVLLIVSFCVLFLLLVLYLAYRKRKELVAELRVKNAEYLMAKEESERLAKAKSNFFSTVSHELRTPLYGVIGLSTLLLEDKGLKSHENDLKSLKFSADYLLALINDVLHLNKIDSKTVENEKAYFNLREQIKTIVSSFEYMRIQNSNTFHINIDEDVPKLIRGNSVRLSQILMNLIGNACKFTEHGEIYVNASLKEISSNQATISFSIKDTGIGIAEGKQASIFEEFSQGNNINYNYQGSGLGLPIVRKLLELSNSEIHVESKLGEGSVFSFDLTYDILNKAYKKETVKTLDTKDLKDKRILIVEDNRINQTVTLKILEREGVICEIAENGEIAIEMEKKSNYDLILMDINMPVMNGLEATRGIRKRNKSIPILALTAVEVEEMRFSIYDSGMNDIIVKPYDIGKFTQTILKHLNGTDSQGDMSKLQAI
ncbi:hybrid sensor histidine kinase/response regulator [Pukyongia salina]|uniref:histidine kinase n=1 Tax=Pukyongia salina TaxID=2094025 RepID=A0A2S0HVS6_9FLAO|nr:response regulator [Pukyongia salina]AVI50791.1 hybrid sensor histidine kinase/response regulator [Pukyongia salina]